MVSLKNYITIAHFTLYKHITIVLIIAMQVTYILQTASSYVLLYAVDVSQTIKVRYSPSLLTL